MQSLQSRTDRKTAKSVAQKSDEIRHVCEALMTHTWQFFNKSPTYGCQYSVAAAFYPKYMASGRI